MPRQDNEPATASCPSVDCASSAGLHNDIGRIETMLDEAGAHASVAGQQNAAQLAVGPSTLKAELARITDETSYVAKMLPLSALAAPPDAVAVPALALVPASARFTAPAAIPLTPTAAWAMLSVLRALAPVRLSTPNSVLVWSLALALAAKALHGLAPRK